VNWSGILLLTASTVIFTVAGTLMKVWALSPGALRAAFIIALYCAGNLIMLRLVRDYGMSSAFSISAVAQLVALNMIAFFWFGEHLATVQQVGILLAAAGVGLIMFGPALVGR
jgi:multidrug transporter EmrE-like cation transporter